MATTLGIRATRTKASPPRPTASLVLPQAVSAPQMVSRREWWLWFSALMVTTLCSVAFVLTLFNSFFSHAEHFYEIRSDQARWATLCLLLVFNSWLVYRQWSFRRMRKQSGAQSADAQANPQQFGEAMGLDAVTGLYTRTSLEQHLGKEVARARRQNSLLSLATLHVEDYSEITARYGKAAVDSALKELARRLKKASRGSDIAARVADDDFLLLLPECGINEVKQVLNRLVPIDISSSGERVPLTYTTGWVDYQPGDLPADLLKRAANLLHLYDSASKDSFASALR